ncbi:hypothetical protein [Celeribacter ethanolicus]|uniref:hypothetical protein n=1 Tax=Celeribacter ethanolicus TaxID=1758178 RepID=UPI0012DD3F12|nr:hypothetical protein [Celeribacter ethanolicus]
MSPPPPKAKLARQSQPDPFMTQLALRRTLLALPLVALPLVALIGCAQTPDLSDRLAPVDTALPWPSLIASPSQTGFEDAASADELAQETRATLARAEALRARAETLANDPVFATDDQTEPLPPLVTGN